MQNYLFDLDGTLTDPSEGMTKATAYALSCFGVQVDDLRSLCKLIGPPLRISFAEIYNFSPEQVEIGMAKFREYYKDTGLYENFAFDGFAELLGDLRAQGKRLFVATSKPTEYAIRILEHFDMLHFFDDVVGSELDGTRSKKIDVIQHVLSNNNIVDLENTVMIGDRKYDIVSAKALGLKSIGILHGFGDAQEFAEAGVDYVVADVAELRILLEGDVL